MDNNKNLWMGVGAVVVLALLIWWFAASNNDDVTPEDESVNSSETSGNNNENVDSTEDTTTGSVNSNGAATLSYQQALSKYANARIQLNNSCQATPNNVTYKNGTSIMLDNRSATTRTVKLGSTYSIKGYGFKIVKLESGTVPATWLMDCDGQQNVATVLIQK